MRAPYEQSLVTPQSEPADDRQVPNLGGGYSFKADDWKRLHRFLILGTEGGTYYATEQKLTRENTKFIQTLCRESPARVLDELWAVGLTNRATKQDPLLFVLALLAGHADALVRGRALSMLPDLARTGTHLFHFVSYLKVTRGFGRQVRRAIAHWYNSKKPRDLAYQLMKYQARDKWSHRDIIRLCHPKPAGDQHAQLFKWALGIQNPHGDIPDLGQLLAAIELTHPATGISRAADLVAEHKLPREVIPTQLLQRPEIWEALLPTMPWQATLRNLATLTRVGLLKPHSNAARVVASRLTDKDQLVASRVHPLQILLAARTYAAGHGIRSSAGTWIPEQRIVNALEESFTMAFAQAPVTKKRLLVALDVSSSMNSPCAGTIISAREVAAALAVIWARTEPDCSFLAFAHTLSPFLIGPRMSITTIMEKMKAMGFGATDCALPMIYATEFDLKVDAFLVITDSETNVGRIHPHEALAQYRRKSGIQNAKLIVLALQANPFTIADPTDPRMLDVVGLDAAVPQLIADFVTGDL